MPLYPKVNASSYTPPPGGMHRAVCVDVVDLGVVERKFQDKVIAQDMIRFVFQVEAINPETGRPFTADLRVGNTVHKKGKLKEIAESWSGRQITSDALAKLDLERLIGRNCTLNVVLGPREGGGERVTKLSVLPAQAGPTLAPIDYTRVINRPGYAPPKHKDDLAQKATPDPLADESHDDFPAEEPVDGEIPF